MAQNDRPAIPDFSDVRRGRGWFTEEPRTVPISIAARAILRALPVVVEARREPNFLPAILLPLFRASAVAWTAGRHSMYAEVFRAAGASVSSEARGATGFMSRAATAVIDAVNAPDDTFYRSGLYGGSAIADAIAAARAAARSADVATEVRSVAAAAAAADAATIDRADGPGARATLAAELTGTPLWSGGVPIWAGNAWAELKRLLLGASDDWDVWVTWYEDRLIGRPSSYGEEFNVAVATLPDKLWQQGPKAVNARIKELMVEQNPTDPIPTPWNSRVCRSRSKEFAALAWDATT
jgi:hypothetical protein